MNRKRIWIVAPALLVAACGDGVPQASFPVQSSKTIESLTPTDLVAICGEMKRVMRAAVTKDELCVMAGGLSAALSFGKETCQDAYSACMQRPDEQLWAGYSCGLKIEGCSATVQEFETCFNDSLVVLKDFVSDLSCSSTKKAPADPASCQALEAKCPGL